MIRRGRIGAVPPYAIFFGIGAGLLIRPIAIF
jgi:hypothetical protein